MSNTPYIVAFSLVSGIGPVKLRLIQERFGDMSLAWRGGPADLIAAGLDDRTVQEFIARRPAISP